MKEEDLIKAIMILKEHHSNEIVINHIKQSGGFSKGRPTLHIRNCVASAINKLIEAGFTLSMNNGLLTVDKY